ncbi:transposase family protein [Streptomyces canus]|uniref:transposase family protein n=1 Tax=Streptomyces canus TaxID=58343 RepID=UPI0027D8E746|nr:transposase family protein [Streptomyces canus]
MSSSPIPAGLGQLAGSDPARSDELHDLLDRLRRLPDPRRLRGRRHPLSYVLALAACGVLAGAKSLTAIEGPDSGPSRTKDPPQPQQRPSRQRRCWTRHGAPPNAIQPDTNAPYETSR